MHQPSCRVFFNGVGLSMDGRPPPFFFVFKQGVARFTEVREISPATCRPIFYEQRVILSNYMWSVKDGVHSEDRSSAVSGWTLASS